MWPVGREFHTLAVHISLHCLLACSNSVRQSLSLPMALCKYLSFCSGCLQDILFTFGFHLFSYDISRCIFHLLGLQFSEHPGAVACCLSVMLKYRPLSVQNFLFPYSYSLRVFILPNYTHICQTRDWHITFLWIFLYKYNYFGKQHVH